MTYSLDRELYGESFGMFLSYIDFDHYGNYEGKDEDVKKRLDEVGDFENDIFSIKPFCWCEYCDGGVELNKNLEPCPRYDKPNFHYKPTDFKLDWYKYPLRGNSCNKEMNPEAWMRMLSHCADSFFDIGMENSVI